MKIWHGYGSEHSMNLVMIGHFRDAEHAARAKDAIDALAEQVEAEVADGVMDTRGDSDRFSDKMLELLQRVSFHDVRPNELEQLGYEYRARLDESKIVITTDESDVSVFMKLLINKGARVEVYSAHEYDDTPYGRGK